MASLVGLLPAKTALAGPTTGEWLNRHQIKAGDSLYVDVGPYDTNENYKKDAGTAECPVIKDFDGSGPNATFVELDSFGDCKKTNPITLTQTGNYDIVGYRIDADTILALPYNPYEPGKRIAFSLFRRPPADERPNDSTYYLVDGGRLNRSVLLRTSPSLRVCMEALGLGGGGEDVVGDGRKYLCFKDGKLWNNGDVAPANVLESIGEDTSNPGGNANNDDSNEVNENSCETKSGAMGWLICPVILITDSALNWVDTQINSLLRVDQAQYTDDRIEGAWRNIRNIAYIILVPIMLVMVIGTALGFQFLDAYTVKRALPRLFAAVIFISVSYPICVFLIELFNSIGSGVIGLLTSPFGDAVSTLSLADLFDGNIFSSIFAVPGLLIGVALMIWLFGGTLLLFAAIAFLVLLIRQIFIIALILVAPLAILAWIFPGNDRLWKSWWSIFSKLLMMYPLILAIIAIGRIFALIINFGGAGQPDVLNPLMKLAAYMLPYAFIPFTFKFAGGVFATVTGVVNDRSKGLFDRQRQSRQQKLERTANQNMFRNAPEGSWRSRMNTAGATVMNARRAGLNLSQWQARMAGALSDNSIMQRENMMKDDEYTWRGDDDLNRAASESNNSEELRQILRTRLGARYQGPLGEENLNRDVAKVEHMRRKYGNSAFRQATFLQAVAGGTAFSYDDPAEVWKAAAAVAGSDNGILADMVAKGKSAAMQAGRVDQAGAGFGDTFKIAQQLRDNPNYTLTQANQDLMEGVIDSSAVATAIYGKPQSARNIGKAHAQRIQRYLDSLSTGTPIQIHGEKHPRVATERDVKQAFASAAGLHDAISQSSPQIARAYADEVMGQGLVISGLSPQARAALGPAFAQQGAGVSSLGPGGNLTIRQVIDGLAGVDQQFSEMRRDYQTASALGAQQQMQQIQQQGGGLPPPGGGLPPGQPPQPSDKRLKRNVQFISRSNGINLYRFQYFWSDQVYVGVIAQELLKTHPFALSTDELGFYKVNYSLLGLKMMTLEEWEEKSLAKKQ